MLERAAWRSDTGGEIFEPGLIRRDLYRLARLLELPRLDDALPTLPREFVVVPDGDEWPARAGVLEIGVGEIAFVDGPVTIERQRDVEVADLVAVRDARHLINRAVVARLHLVGILDHLVDEISEVQDEIELLGGGSAFVFVNHPAICVELPLIDILTADKREVHRARVIVVGRGHGSADAAPVAITVAEAIPIDARGFESSHQNATGPIRCGRNRHRRAGCDSLKQLIFRNLQGQAGLFAGT